MTPAQLCLRRRFWCHAIVGAGSVTTGAVNSVRRALPLEQQVGVACYVGVDEIAHPVNCSRLIERAASDLVVMSMEHDRIQ